MIYGSLRNACVLCVSKIKKKLKGLVKKINSPANRQLLLLIIHLQLEQQMEKHFHSFTGPPYCHDVGLKFQLTVATLPYSHCQQTPEPQKPAILPLPACFVLLDTVNPTWNVVLPFGHIIAQHQPKSWIAGHSWCLVQQ